MDTTRFLITVKSIYIKMGIVNHPYSSETITQVLAFSPQDRLIKNIWIVRNQLHLQKFFFLGQETFLKAYHLWLRRKKEKE